MRVFENKIGLSRPVFVNVPGRGSHDLGYHLLSDDIQKEVIWRDQYTMQQWRCEFLGWYDMTHYWPNGSEPIVAGFYRAIEVIKEN
jgi:dTDP-D-glucose 4,6-dehydratase